MSAIDDARAFIESTRDPNEWPTVGHGFTYRHRKHLVAVLAEVEQAQAPRVEAWPIRVEAWPIRCEDCETSWHFTWAHVWYSRPMTTHFVSCPLCRHENIVAGSGTTAEAIKEIRKRFATKKESDGYEEESG